LKAQVDIFVSLPRDVRSLPNFPFIDIQSEDWLPAPTLAQIERQQPHAASDIEDRFLRARKQLVSRGINGITPQFASHIATQPPLGKLRGHTRARRFVSNPIGGEVFHLIRIIALPD
jgi:hypothetical protein